MYSLYEGILLKGNLNILILSSIHSFIHSTNQAGRRIPKNCFYYSACKKWPPETHCGICWSNVVLCMFLHTTLSPCWKMVVNTELMNRETKSPFSGKFGLPGLIAERNDINVIIPKPCILVRPDVFWTLFSSIISFNGGNQFNYTHFSSRKTRPGKVR